MSIEPFFTQLIIIYSQQDRLALIVPIVLGIILQGVLNDSFHISLFKYEDNLFLYILTDNLIESYKLYLLYYFITCMFVLNDLLYDPSNIFNQSLDPIGKKLVFISYRVHK